MNPCDNCIHFPICNIRDDYRQLLVDAEPLQKIYPAFEVTANCKYFRIDSKKITDGNEAMNRL